MGLMNAPEDYASFYHEVNGQRVRHDKVHNLYGGSMTRAAGEAFADLRPGKRTLLYSRSSLSAATAMAASGWATTIPAGSSCWPTSR